MHFNDKCWLKGKLVYLVFFLIVIAAGISGQADKIPSIEEAIEIIENPQNIFFESGPIGGYIEVYERLTWLRYRVEYKYERRHAPIWRNYMRDEKRSMYGRLCAAHFLLDTNEEAREFVTKILKSENLRYRYNAAETIRLYVGRDSKKEWGVDVLIGLIADGSIDEITEVGPIVIGTYAYQDGDVFNTLMTPIDDICRDMGRMKEPRAVPALISFLQRRPHMGDAAEALGEIGDKRAVPVLMKILRENSAYDDSSVITALGKLKHKEVVPILISRIGHARTIKGMDYTETESIFEALLEIGDKRAVEPIERYLKAPYPKTSEDVARRVLVQLNSSDPVKDLIALFEKETDEYARSEILWDLTRYDDNRVVKKFEAIARTSNSAFMRYQAIRELRDIGDKQSLLVLASLLDVVFPKDLKAEHGWEKQITPDFSKYFPETIVEYLKHCTKQDFGKDRAKWEEWIDKNVD